MRAKVTRKFIGKAADSQKSVTYKPGQMIEGPMAEYAVRKGMAEKLSAAEKTAPANKAEAAAPENKAGRDPRAPAMQPAPVKPK